MGIPRWLRWTLASIAGLLLVAGLLAGAGWWYLHPVPARANGLVYGTRHGQPLTMDVLIPLNAHGRAVALMVSGSWKSRPPGSVSVPTVAVLLRAGYTIFAISHRSQPEATVMEIIEDVQRGIRYARHHARDYGVDPARIGVVGGSSGGHLSLMLATCGGNGDPAAADPVDRESSAVQAVAVFFPVTDLLNLGSSTENAGDGGPPKSYRKAFGPRSMEMPVWKQIGRESSPIYFIHQGMPPVLIHHGDADTLVPLEQSKRFQARARELGLPVELVVHPGKGHGWPTMVLDSFAFVRWFDQHLR